ncbi:hypothetical protein RRG08_059877 [Elysia crispata]|uniref:Uncharacterized protein n=1 Tax=Elysia crispata TaxID=231223 RepID=A0AAE0ZH71_9GAST|nr:hypothetical protein RRG08_059877 [Elysia crispata]
MVTDSKLEWSMGTRSRYTKESQEELTDFSQRLISYLQYEHGAKTKPNHVLSSPEPGQAIQIGSVLLCVSYCPLTGFMLLEYQREGNRSYSVNSRHQLGQHSQGLAKQTEITAAKHHLNSSVDQESISVKIVYVYNFLTKVSLIVKQLAAAVTRQFPIVMASLVSPGETRLQAALLGGSSMTGS